MPARILISGDRFWNCPYLALRVLERLVARYGHDLVLVHGDCTGVDESFATAAGGLGITVEAHPADWDALGKRAGPVRNAAMVAAGATLCLAFHRYLPGSKGTKDCARQALAAGIPTYLIDSDTAEPKRLRAGDPRLE